MLSSLKWLLIDCCYIFPSQNTQPENQHSTRKSRCMQRTDSKTINPITYPTEDAWKELLLFVELPLEGWQRAKSHDVGSMQTQTQVSKKCFLFWKTKPRHIPFRSSLAISSLREELRRRDKKRQEFRSLVWTTKWRSHPLGCSLENSYIITW